MTRIGKIARMPAMVREELNRRLHDGEQGQALLAWLNGLPEAQQVLAAQFNGAPVNKQNLSDWRQGGFQDWLRHQESCALVRELNQQGAELNQATDGALFSDRLGALLAVEVARMSQTMLAAATEPKERWECLRGLLGRVSALRRDDHRATRLKLAQQRQGWVESDRARKQAELELAGVRRQKNQPELRELWMLLWTVLTTPHKEKPVMEKAAAGGKEQGKTGTRKTEGGQTSNVQSAEGGGQGQTSNVQRTTPNVQSADGESRLVKADQGGSESNQSSVKTVVSCSKADEVIGENSNRSGTG